jgi:hypothetical protein
VVGRLIASLGIGLVMVPGAVCLAAGLLAAHTSAGWHLALAAIIAAMAPILLWIVAPRCPHPPPPGA